MQIGRYRRGFASSSPPLLDADETKERHNADPEFSEKFFGLIDEEDTIALYLTDGPFSDTVRNSIDGILRA